MDKVDDDVDKDNDVDKMDDDVDKVDGWIFQG